MIIDIHSHIATSWQGWWKSKVNEEAFVKHMDKWGIDKACVSYWSINADPDAGNDRVSRFVEQYPDRIIGFACIVPRWNEDAIAETEKAIKDPNMTGLKLHPAANSYYADSPLVYPIIEMAIEADMPILFHCGDDQYSNPRNLGNLAKKFPQAKIIMGHSGCLEIIEGIQVARCNENIWLDTTDSWNLLDIINVMIKYVGEERILWGSDFPCWNTGPEISKVRDANITDRQKELIFGKNAAKLLKLE